MVFTYDVKVQDITPELGGLGVGGRGCYPCGLLGASGRKHLTWAKDVANLGHRAREEEMAKYGFE